MTIYLKSRNQSQSKISLNLYKGLIIILGGRKENYYFNNNKVF